MLELDLPSAWMARGALAWALRPLSWVYGVAWQVRTAAWHWRARRNQAWGVRLPVPVIVVGNVVVGGAGKTPTLIALVQHLQARGWQPGVIARGVGGRVSASRDGIAVHGRGEAVDPAECGDEPALVAQRTGVALAVGRNRAAAARALLQHQPTVKVLVSDDGMQHWALGRDLTIVVFDERDVGNGWLLPAGPLRQPWPAAPWGNERLLVLRTAAAQRPPRPHPYPEFRAQRTLSALAFDADGQSQPLADWAARATPVGALAGIARPQAFFDALRARGLQLTATVPLPDHASGPVLHAALQHAAQRPHAPRVWLCTDKDAIKLQRHRAPAGVTLWRVPLRLEIDPALFDAVDAVLAAHALS
ncbi:tetraacyldisaccharide 4'-kinase [Tepidimonas charontis]|uniref:Tetraacyldisaccharide 4'-kinase n=1 Tax=Tepidimonas charontis TaxID=2267262 RepID=A0A554XHQ6_9BURK|nr:tetraacyldisaccharide 4'-kinase [Tepidimonas charontis]TSE35353.1 Tetraacyldisaccharide 4'-kinase [Tepidimonas charontis]